MTTAGAMSPGLYQFVSLDAPALLTLVLTAATCALLGNFLVLRRQGLMGDAISHSVLPGLVAAFLLTGSRSTIPMLLGAAGAGVAAAVLIELVRSLARLESGAAMGVVFTVMFALGVVLLEQAAARGVDIDPDCVLYGQLEDVFWMPPASWGAMLSAEALFGPAGLPRELLTAAGVGAVAALFVCLLHKELVLSSFDPELATSLGISARAMHYALMVVVAGAVVASFEAVGSILVIALLICPASTARLLTDRMGVQLALTLGIATFAAIAGYVLGALVPGWLGYSGALSVSGMVTCVLGALLGVCVAGAGARGALARRRTGRVRG